MISSRLFWMVAIISLIAASPVLADQPGQHVHGYQMGDGYYGPIDAGKYYTGTGSALGQFPDPKVTTSADSAAAAQSAEDQLAQATRMAEQAKQQLAQAQRMIEAAKAAQAKAQQVATSAATSITNQPAKVAAASELSMAAPDTEVVPSFVAPLLPVSRSQPPGTAVAAAQPPKPAAAFTTQSPQPPAATPVGNSQIASLEQRIFSRNYDTDTDFARLSRLEQFVFGAPRPGPEAERIAALMKAFQTQHPAKPSSAAVAANKSNAPATVAALMQEGRSEFAQKAFHAARDTFEQATQKSANDQDAHFWLAMAYWHLYDYSNAKAQLEIVFRLNPFNTEGRVAKSQMLDITQYLAKDNSPPVDSPDIVAHSMAQMQHQADCLENQKLSDGELTAAHRTWAGIREANKIQAQTDGFFNPGWGWRPWYMRDVSDWGYIRSNYAYMDGLRQAELSRLDAAQRANNVQDWANSLLSQMSAPWRPGQPHLRAFGTNLYVQYYGDEDPYNPTPVAAPDPPLQATALSFHPNIKSTAVKR